MSEVPEAIRRAAEQEERTERALERATAPFGGVEPEPPQTPAQEFTERMAEQRRAEDEREQRVNRLMHENPSPDVDDPLRTLYQQQRARRRRRRV
jgi:hypothetical protein